jgi:AraC-like DNA-binding protein
MKVVPFSVPKISRQAFRFQDDQLPYFYDKLHQHPELQIMLILKSEGTLIAGDYVGRFEPGDLYVIGSEQAHVFRNDDVYYPSKSKLKAHSHSIYFDENYVGEHFWQLDELESVRSFSKRADRGLKIIGESKETATHLIQQIPQQKGMERLLSFLQLLNLLANTKEVKPLSVSFHNPDYSNREGKRMNDILQFTFRESYRKIYIDEVADVANLSTEAFCRYFKLRTRKTYTNFLNEVRISNACKLIIQNDLSIQEICHQSGFSNLSNFNRIFRKVTGRTPTTYFVTDKS